MTPESSDTAHPAIQLRFMGLRPYEPVHRAMLDFTVARGPETPDEIWILQHRPVFTQGQAGKAEHILDARHIPVVKTDRGGQVTYHGPGQLVIYLLIDIKRKRLGVRELVDLIENAVIQVLAGYGIRSESKRGAPGVYVADRKIAALGLRVKRGCSYHGLSFNIDMDLTPFAWINPCGYEGLEVTQLKDLLDGPRDQLVEAVQARLVRELRQSLIYSGATEQSE